VDIDVIDNRKFKDYSKEILEKVEGMSENVNDDDKSKFREALEKKKQSNSPQGRGKSGDSKVRGGQSGGGAPKMFRRKSGSS
jgi:hypothetical protein